MSDMVDRMAAALLGSDIAMSETVAQNLARMMLVVMCEPTPEMVEIGATSLYGCALAGLDHGGEPAGEMNRSTGWFDPLTDRFRDEVRDDARWVFRDMIKGALK